MFWSNFHAFRPFSIYFAHFLASIRPTNDDEKHSACNAARIEQISDVKGCQRGRKRRLGGLLTGLQAFSTSAARVDAPIVLCRGASDRDASSAIGIYQKEGTEGHQKWRGSVDFFRNQAEEACFFSRSSESGVAPPACLPLSAAALSALSAPSSSPSPPPTQIPLSFSLSLALPTQTLTTGRCSGSASTARR